MKNEINKIYHRPWGNYRILLAAENYQVKIITINPLESLSLQKHNHRSEQWTVLQGTPTITINDFIKTYRVGERVIINKKSLHRAENCHQTPAIIVEIQFGNYLGEDDIIRLEDKYGRIS